jgi:hypothetical protein
MYLESYHIFGISIALLFVSAFAFYKMGIKALALMLPIAAIIGYKQIGSFDVLAMLMTPLVLGSSCGFTLAKRKSLQFYILLSVSVLTVIEVAQYYYQVHFLNIDIIDQVKSQMPVFFKQLNMEDVKVSQQDIDLIVSLMRITLPFNIFFNNLLWSGVAFVLLRPVLSIFIERKPIPVRGLEFFRLNDYTIFIVIACLALFIFVKRDQNELIYLISINGLLIGTALYYVQALGIIRHFLIRKRLPVYLLPVGILVTFAFNKMLFFFVSIVLAGWGMLDLWTDFRRLHKKDSNTENN